MIDDFTKNLPVFIDFQMDCSRYSDNVKALWSIAAFNEDTSSLSKLTVNLAYKMCLSLRDSRVCSKVEANELRGLFEERFSYSYMKDKRGRTVVFLFFWEKVAYEFIRYIILMSENLTNSFPNCCRYTRTCSDDCIWHQLLEHFRDSMFYSKKLLYIHSVSGKNSLIISYNTTCPICATLKEFTAEDDFVYFPDCHHFICQACAFKMLSKVIMK